MARESKWPKCRPGRPVLETLVAEVYGPAMDRRIELARDIRDLFKQTKGVVDVDWYVEDDQTKYRLLVDKEKAALNGISEDDIARAMQVASTGYQAGLLHQDAEKEDVSLTVRLDRATRSDLERIQGLKIAGRNGRTVRSRRIGALRKRGRGQEHLSQEPVACDLCHGRHCGRDRKPGLCNAQTRAGDRQDQDPGRLSIEQHMAALPSDPDRYSMKWDGEWHITYELFRDLGIAFAAVLILIYGLWWAGSSRS